MPARYTYLTVIDDSQPGVPDREVTCAFVLLQEDEQGLYGWAPPGFVPDVLGSMLLPLGELQAGEGPLSAEFIFIPAASVAALDTDWPLGSVVMGFDDEGGWPDAEMAVAASVDFIDGEVVMVGGGFHSADEAPAGIDGNVTPVASLTRVPLVLGMAPPAAAEPAPLPGAGRGRGAPKAARVPRLTAAGQLLTLQSQLEAVLAGQESLAARFDSRITSLESGRAAVPAGGRGSGLFALPVAPPPGLQGLASRLVPAPPRAGRGSGPLVQAPTRQDALSGFHSFPTTPERDPFIQNVAAENLQQRARAASGAGRQQNVGPPAARSVLGGLGSAARSQEAVGGTPGQFGTLVSAIEQQTAAIGALVTSRHSTTGLLDEGGAGMEKLPGGRGAGAQRIRRRQLKTDPMAVSQAIRANRDERLDGASLLGRSQGGRTKTYLVQEVPFNRAKTATYAAFGFAEIFDLMEAGHWHAAEAQTGLMLVAFEQAAMDDWKWHHAARLSLLADPPFHHLLEVQGSTLNESVSHLAEAEWVQAAMAYSKDLALFKQKADSAPQVPAKGKQKGQPAAKAAALPPGETQE